MDAFQGERDGATTVRGCCGPDDAQSVDLLQRLERVRRQLVLVLRDFAHPEVGRVANSGPDAPRLRDGWRARLELVRRHRPGRPGHGDLVDHLAAAEEGWPLLKPS